MRAIIELMRWTGLRIGDALMCAKSRIHGNRFNLTTQKGKTALTVIIPDHVITALNALPPSEDVHQNYFFWSGGSKYKSLTGRWQRKLERLPASMAAMGIAGSRRCSREPVGRWARTESSASPPRIWRREGLKVPKKQKPGGRLWLNDGSCVRLRPTHPNHVWSYDFVSARTHDGRSVRILNLIDESTRECLLIRAERRWSSAKVIEALASVMVLKGVPEHVRSDNGPEFVAKDLRNWLAGSGARTLYIEPGSPWENGYCESFNSKLRDEFLNGEIVYSIKELPVLAERWCVHYNTVRPHSSLGYKPPAPETWLTATSKGCGAVETASRFPLLHTLDGGYLNSEINALH